MTLSNVIQCTLHCFYLSKPLSKAMVCSLLSSCNHLTPIACMKLDHVLEGWEEG